MANTEPVTGAPTEPEETQAATDAPEQSETPAAESETEPAESARPAGKNGIFYRIYHSYNNYDFVSSYGHTFNDGEGGYTYYPDLGVLDAIEELDGSYIYCWSDYDELEAGYYKMTWAGGRQVGLDRNYMYEKVGELEDTWPGLPFGETC